MKRLWIEAAAMFLAGATPSGHENRLVAKVAAAVHRSHLAPAGCLEYFAMSDTAAPASDLVRVSRKHGGSCGGDPSTDEHLFDVHVSRATGKMTTNARDPEGLEETPLAP